MSSPDNTQSKYAAHPPVWQERFAFFEQHGAPGTPTYKQAFKALGIGARLRVNLNWFGFFFSFIYFFIKGMWKPALTLIGIGVVMAIGISFLPYTVIGYGLDRGLSVAFAMLAGMSANYCFYRFAVLGEHDFNPFKGMRWI